MVLDHDAAMVGAARGAVGTWLSERGCRTGDDAVLVLSELVTNAMVHAAAGCTVEVRHSDDVVRLEVQDRSRQAPAMRPVGPSDVGGQGLLLVEALAEAWGWEPTADGKGVWAVFRAAARRPEGDGRADLSSS